MKTLNYILFVLMSCSIVLVSCKNLVPNAKEVPEVLVGQWESQEIKVTVRTQHGYLKYSFTPGKAKITLNINKDKSIGGSIGSYKFNNGVLKKSNIYIIVCDSVGKIFLDDPLKFKEVSFWLFDLTEKSINAELRYTENGQQYPMAGFELIKK